MELLLNQLKKSYPHYTINYFENNIAIFRGKKCYNKDLVEWFSINKKIHTVPVLLQKIKGILNSDIENLNK